VLFRSLIGNPVLSWFAGEVTGKRFAAILPAAAWCAVWIVAATKTHEGDLIITGNNWVGLVTLLAGPIAFALGIFIPTYLETRRALPPRPPTV